jgi:carbon-monoxide dehydrogenase large subunit
MIDNGLASRTNIFGAKGCGEAGASAAPPAVMNAIADALSEYPGVEDLQMPARAEDIRRIINGVG